MTAEAFKSVAGIETQAARSSVSGTSDIAANQTGNVIPLRPDFTQHTSTADTHAKLEAIRKALVELPPAEGKNKINFTEVVKDASSNLQSQEINTSTHDRLIRQTVKLARKKLGKKSLSELYDSTGLTQEMVQQAKKSGRIELVKSGRYFLTSEAISTAVGWTAEQLHVANVFDIKNTAILIAAAVGGRVATVGMLAWKAHLNEKRIEEVDGVGTDPLAKLSHENGKGKLGFIVTNGVAELYYAAQTGAIAAISGLKTALVFDSAASWAASAKLLGENLYLTRKIHKARKEK